MQRVVRFSHVDGLVKSATTDTLDKVISGILNSKLRLTNVRVKSRALHLGRRTTTKIVKLRGRWSCHTLTKDFLRCNKFLLYVALVLNPFHYLLSYFEKVLLCFICSGLWPWHKLIYTLHKGLVVIGLCRSFIDLDGSRGVLWNGLLMDRVLINLSNTLIRREEGFSWRLLQFKGIWRDFVLSKSSLGLSSDIIGMIPKLGTSLCLLFLIFCSLFVKYLLLLNIFSLERELFLFDIEPLHVYGLWPFNHDLKSLIVMSLWAQ